MMKSVESVTEPTIEEKLSPKETVDSGKLLEEAYKSADEQRRNISAHVLMNAFNEHPDSVVIGTFKDGKINVQVTPFESAANLALVGHLVKFYVEKNIESGIQNNSGGQELGRQAPPESLL